MTDSAVERRMADATATDLALRRLEVLFPELEHGWGALAPPDQMKKKEPSPQAIDDMRKSCDQFQEILDCLIEAQKRRSTNPPFAADYDALYARLRLTGRVEAGWQQLKKETKKLKQLHDDQFPEEGHCPNDLEYILTQQLSHGLGPLKDALESYEKYLRHHIVTMDRAKARKVSILDLPAELMVRIFGYVRHPYGLPWYENTDYFTTYKGPRFFGAIKGLQDSRLVCRQFHSLVSPLMLDHIYVDIHPDSLARLVEVSQNSKVAQGIRGVHINLRAYQKELVEDLSTFARVQLETLERDIEMMDISPASQWYPGCAPTTCRKRIRELQTVAQAWRHLIRAKPNEDFESTLQDFVKSHIKALRASHKEYQKQYKAQQDVLQNRHFIQTVVAALSRMPSLHFLAFGEAFHRFEFESYLRQKRLTRIPVDKADKFVKLYNGNHHSFFVGTAQPHPSSSTDVVLPILVGLSGKKIVLEHLAIWGCEPNLRPNLQQRESIAILAKKLLTVSIGAGGINTTADVPMADSHSFLNCLLKSDSLKGIKLGTIYTGFESGPISTGLGSFSSGGATPFLHLKKIAITEKSLVHLIMTVLKSGSQKIHVDFKEVNLLAGKWAVVLDVLRDNVTSTSKVNSLTNAEFGNDFETPFDWLFYPIPAYDDDDGEGGEEDEQCNYIEKYLLSLKADQQNPVRKFIVNGVLQP